jgi:cytoskeletal protein CcmA (bactofilin family)
MGKIDGNIDASDRIEMKSTTRLNGDIKAKRLTVEDGVTFIGRSEVNPAGTGGAAQSKPTSIPNTQDSSGKSSESDTDKQKNMFGKK